jgi:AcrR family transcriptional regulator
MMADQTGTSEIETKMIDAAMAIAVDGGWRGAGLAGIAARAEIDLLDARRYFRDKRAILGTLARRIDDLVDENLDEDATDPSLSVRDRLFDVLMSRFDALLPYRAGIAGVLRALPGQPITALAGLPALGQAMARTLKAVGVSAAGPCGALRVKGLAGIFLATLRVWLRDDSDDNSATMKELDRRLKDAESLVNMFSGRTKPEPATSS